MKMLANPRAVASAQKGSCIVGLSDSQYSSRAFTNGGTKNHDLIELFDKYGMERDVCLEWVRGHDGNPLNEWCDYWSNHEYKAMFESAKTASK